MSLWLFTPLFPCINVWCIDSAYVDVSISKPCMCCIAKQLLATLISHPYAIWKRGLDKEMCQRETKANLRKRWLNYLREWVTLIVGNHQNWLKASTMPLQVAIRNHLERLHILYPCPFSFPGGSRTQLNPIACLHAVMQDEGPDDFSM